MIRGGPDITLPTHWRFDASVCARMKTHSIKTLIFLNLAVFQMNSSLWYCMWLNSSNNIYCVNRKPGTVSPMLFKAMFLCQKLLGNGLFCVFLSQFLRMPIQIMSTKWKRFSDHCIVLTKIHINVLLSAYWSTQKSMTRCMCSRKMEGVMGLKWAWNLKMGIYE